MSEKSKIIKTDFLIIGGGIAGLEAALTAAGLGVDVAVAEKADTRRSGNGANGNDHYMCYIPECHGTDFDLVISQIRETMEGPWQDLDLLRYMMRRSFEIVQEWESLGIRMRPTGTYRFEGHAMPNRQRYHLKYDGADQKKILTETALKRGARIYNKVFINDILKNKEGRAVGAVGFSIQEDEPELVVFQCKAVLVATAQAMRLYPHGNPTYIFNTHSCPAAAGGAAIAYRAGVKLINLDVPYIHAGIKGFHRSGKATWIGVLSDINGKSISPFCQKPNRETGDAMMDIWPTIFGERLANGTGPTYMNCTQCTPEDLAYQERAFESEGIDSITDYCHQRGIDLSKTMVEFGSYDYSLGQRGIEIDIHAATNVPGIYAAGVCCGNVRGNITNASVWGKTAAECVAEYIRTVPEESVESHPLIRQRQKQYETYMNRENGADWLEANSTLQQIMGDYVGLKVRSEDMLRAGIKYLNDLRDYTLAEISCEDSHQLMRAMEVLDLIDLGKAVALTSENRKETRGHHHRVDYTYTNPLLNNMFQTIYRDESGETHMEFRPMRMR